MKGKVGSGTGFSWEFSGQFYMVYILPFSPALLQAESCSFLYGLKDLFTLIIKTDDITSSRRDVDLYGRLWAGSGMNGLRTALHGLLCVYI